MTKTRHLLILVAALIGLFSALPTTAQNVYISPETGKLIAATTYDGEFGFQNGFSSLWRHDQLGLTMVVADDGTLTDGGELKNPAGNLSTVNGKLTLTGGQSRDCYIVVSLPKGFRFTGYSITLNNDMNGVKFTNDFSTVNVRKIFYETGSNFSTTNPKAQTDVMPGTNDTKDYTINRSASRSTDMGNRLYFLLQRASNGFYGVSIKSFVVYFSADAPFDQPLETATSSPAMSVAEASFMVGKPELGTIKPNTKNGQTYYSYDYRNVKDLTANNILYQESAVKDGKADDSNTSIKTITSVTNNGQTYYALAKGSTEADNTYYVETPVTLTSESGHEFPTGYRITGAEFKFDYGKDINEKYYYIPINKNGEASYLQSNLSTNNNKETKWEYSNNRISINGKYLRVQSNRSDGYYLSTTTRTNNATTFKIDSQNRIYTNINDGFLSWHDYYIHENSTSGNVAILTTDATNAAQLVSSYSGFKAEVYDKTGKTVAETADISSSNTSQTITLTGLNNDAVKFKISGLADGSQALVRITLTMEHLNPYIHSMDVVGREDSNPDNKLTQSFTADNFTVRGGHFTFNVPENSKGHTWNFEFDNLTSNYTDDTYKSDSYTGATDGNARIAFVQSKYFLASENLYDSNPDYSPASDKLQVVEIGTEPFRFNNADQLSNTSTSQAESQLEEYPFSVDAYTKDTGYKDANGNPIKGEFKQLSMKEGDDRHAYLFVSDETRYNIAPTTATQHRYYAHYSIDITLEEREYQLTVEPVKVYDKTLYVDNNNEEKENSMWGIKVSTTEANGYANLGNVIDKISELVSKKENGLTSTDQVLYVDMSTLQTIMLSQDQARATSLNHFRQAFAPNCLIYLPNSTADKVDNCANKPEANGSFTANANIVLVDKQPFFAPYDINVPATSYAKYTRTVSHSKNAKSNLTSIVLPFQFTVSTDGEHTNDNSNSRAGDGKTLTISKLATENAISPDKGESLGNFNNNVLEYDQYVHFNIYKPSTGKTEAYKPYLVYVDTEEQLEDDKNFTVLEYGADVKATPTEQTTSGSTTTSLGKIKIADEDEETKSTGVLEGQTFTLTPTATMAGCKLQKNDEKCLYFSNNRFCSSWTLSARYEYAICYPFRSWFAYSGATSAKNSVYGIAFGESGELTGIDDIKAEEAEKTGTYKFIRNGQLYIHTDNGVYTVDGRKVNL